jgi:hypothetical protein
MARSSKLNRSQKTRKLSQKAVGAAVLTATAALMAIPQSSAFVVCNMHTTNTLSTATSLNMGSSSSSEDDISRQVAKAKALLEKSKAKLEAPNIPDEKDERTSSAAAVVAMPFFASVDKSQPKKINDKIIKSRNEKDGTVVADGDMMAKLSEEEQWEIRSLYEVFENEAKETSSTAKLAERDVAASIFNLRKQLQESDFQRIFDKRNRWIGEQ